MAVAVLLTLEVPLPHFRADQFLVRKRPPQTSPKPLHPEREQREDRKWVEEEEEEDDAGEAEGGNSEKGGEGGRKECVALSWWTAAKKREGPEREEGVRDVVIEWWNFSPKEKTRCLDLPIGQLGEIRHMVVGNRIVFTIVSIEVQTMELRKHHISLQNEVTYVRGSRSGSDDDDSAFKALKLDRGANMLHSMINVGSVSLPVLPSVYYANIFALLPLFRFLDLLNHPKPNDWRGKLCPYYEDLGIIFGKDRALEKNVQGPEEIEDDVNEEEENEESSKKDEPGSLSA
ncbi:hypothetical protein Cgig2_026369 [Carnegiea gigantea]|uniref:Uncharacterized protein n=1 Tax=Carnegiea gigantea TaxID=171969 RepID=A0A9Q1QGG6_9CARY|nr:hypothetical protein Cgig2_026369 [Carnegiea gigantea]